MRKFSLTFDIPDGMTVAEFARTLGYVAEHFTLGFSSEQRAERTVPNAKGLVWDHNGNSIGAFRVGEMSDYAGSATRQQVTPDASKPHTFIVHNEIDLGKER